MSSSGLKRLVSRLPRLWQQELKRLKYRHQIYHQRFRTQEPEYRVLDSMIEAGDWVIDVGANIGHYTKKFSDLVGPQGRVIALEPVPETFALLSANATLFQHNNVTLLNLAVSDQPGVASMQVPLSDTGLNNYYEAKLSTDRTDLNVWSLTLDSLTFSQPIKLIKIDAEGHDPAVLRSAESLLARDHPILIVETITADIAKNLQRFGYVAEQLPDSPNTLFR